MATGKYKYPIEYLYDWYVKKDYNQDGPTQVKKTIKRARNVWPAWEPLFDAITIMND